MNLTRLHTTLSTPLAHVFRYNIAKDSLSAAPYSRRYTITMHSPLDQLSAATLNPNPRS